MSRCQVSERCRGCPLVKDEDHQPEAEILLKPCDRLALRLIAPEKAGVHFPLILQQFDDWDHVW